MTSAAGATYTYNVQGLRTKKTVGSKTTNFTLVGGKVVSDGTSNYFWATELVTNGSVYYLYNAHGDVIQLLNSSGAVTKTYDYDAYGNELTRDLNDPNPFRYCGEYYDTETGFIYLRARYYNPSVGRFISVDPVKDGINWYAYCGNNPISYADPWGLRPKDLTPQATAVCLDGGGGTTNKLSTESTSVASKKSDEKTPGSRYEEYYNSVAYKKVKDCADDILTYAEYYDVDPNVVAGVIFAEQYYNYDWIDVCTDWVAFYDILDTSIGLGQVKMSTAKYLEEAEYIKKNSAYEGGWNIPLIGTIYGTETMAREKRLEDNKMNIMYVAAYIRLFVDNWSKEYPSIAESPEILGTLYNLGDKPPHKSPKPNWFGKAVGYFYDLMGEMLS